MSYLRFNHVFTALLLLSLLSAFVFPKQTSGLRSHVQGIFYPVAKPARMIASTVRGPFDRADDKRPAQEVVAENHRLRASLASLTGQLEHLQQIQADRERFGHVGKFCTPVAVMGNDSASRDSLSIRGAFPATLIGQPVLYVGGLAGTIERAGLAGAQVCLVTDRSFSASGRIGTFIDDGAGGARFQTKKVTPPLVEGCGKGVIMIRNIEFKELVEEAGVTEGFWVVLDDKDYPNLLRHQKIGRIVSIKKRPEAPLWADVEVRPEWNLMALPEVMVLGKTGNQNDERMTKPE